MKQQQGEGGSSSSKPSTPRGQDPGPGVNIKIIETQTVHTDVTHFKSVVQSLTGKDSVAALKSPESSGQNVQPKVEEGEREGKGEFDDILKIKLPSLEELKEFWDD